MYRSAATSLPARTRNRLTGREDWYRTKKRRKRDEWDNVDREHRKRKREKENK